MDEKGIKSIMSEIKEENPWAPYENQNGFIADLIKQYSSYLFDKASNEKEKWDAIRMRNASLATAKWKYGLIRNGYSAKEEIKGVGNLTARIIDFILEHKYLEIDGVRFDVKGIMTPVKVESDEPITSIKEEKPEKPNPIYHIRLDGHGDKVAVPEE